MVLNITCEQILAVYEAGPEAVITLINSIQSENQKIVEHQATRISELEERVKSLEVTLNKNSQNSSKPPIVNGGVFTTPFWGALETNCCISFRSLQFGLLEKVFPL